MTRIPLLLALFLTAAALANPTRAETADGYRGIWFTLGQKSEHGDKYSGGLGTYTANHVPIAVHSTRANKTFFVYGGTKKAESHLLIMASYYDHATNRVPRPTIVLDKGGVNDPHDNAAIALDDAGHVWVFVSGRARKRPGYIFRSTQPFSVESFEQADEREMTYPQPAWVKDRGFFYLFTKYTAGREIYWQTSIDGNPWDPEQKLAGFGGHYQVSNSRYDGKTRTTTIGSAFMYHPGGSVDKRTNLYYVQTSDLGAWTTADGGPLKTPLIDIENPALVIDYQAQGLNVYIHDLNFDRDGFPAILYLTSKGHEPGPKNDPRTWRVTRWTGSAWETHEVCTSDHNYDTGCLFTDGDRWTVIGPTDPGPQPLGTGGEMVAWTSDDAGRTWRRVRHVTRGSRFNQSYARRTRGAAADPFSVFWADGDPNQMSESRLYFATKDGDRVWALPYDMDGEWAEPIGVTPK